LARHLSDATVLTFARFSEATHKPEDFMMDRLRNRYSISAWQWQSLPMLTWLCCLGCLQGEGFKASDFTRDDAPAAPAVRAPAAPISAGVPAMSAVTPPSPVVAEPGPSAEAAPSASDVSIEPPVMAAPAVEVSPAEGSDDPVEDRSMCSMSGNEVGIIGDSYIDFTTFTEHLQRLAREAGALASAETYVDHALAGASMNGLPSIPAQWPEALADSRARGAEGIRLVIMTGGGNDILVNNRQCLDFRSVADITDACKTVVSEALDTAGELFNQLAEDGVDALVYFYYPHLPRFSLFGGSSPNTMLDYSLPLVRSQCEAQAEPPCYFVDLSPSFDDGSGFARPELISIDGIHPTDAGAVLMADDVWATMTEHCLAVE
jgi:lysophospholipase L1-like esterase